MSGLPRAEFLFDFGSPNAYFAHKVIPDIEARTGVTFVYVPVLLGGIFKLTGNRSPAEAFAGIESKLRFMHEETERFMRKHDLSAFRQNPHFPVNTLMLMRGAVAAQKEGVFAQYVDAAFHHMWEQPKKMDDLETLRDAFRASGLDADRLIARAQDADVKAELLENTNKAAARGVFGAPSFFVVDELFFGKDQLRDVEEEIVARKAKAA